MSKKGMIKKYKGRYNWYGYLKRYLLKNTTKRKNEHLNKDNRDKDQ